MRTKDHTNRPVSYTVVPSPFGRLAVVWHETGGRAVVLRVILPSQEVTPEARVQATFDHARLGRHPVITELADRLEAFLQGEPIAFRLDSVGLQDCSEFQRRVLVAEHGIPRGWVSTYGLIAGHLGVKGGARAVGRALATNPFPLIIPCHRAIRCSGELGGFQGGFAMKRRLLEMEGVEVSEAGLVVRPRLHYAT